MTIIYIIFNIFMKITILYYTILFMKTYLLCKRISLSFKIINFVIFIMSIIQLFMVGKLDVLDQSSILTHHIFMTYIWMKVMNEKSIDNGYKLVNDKVLSLFRIVEKMTIITRCFEIFMLVGFHHFKKYSALQWLFPIHCLLLAYFFCIIICQKSKFYK